MGDTIIFRRGRGGSGSGSSANSAFTGKRLVANNCRLPTTFSTSANWVQNCWTKHKSGPSGFSKGIYASFVNCKNGTNSELDAAYDFILRSGIYVNGKFTQGSWISNDSIDTTLAKEWGKDTVFFDVAIPPNTEFYITNRRVATDGGAAGTYDVITNANGNTLRADGVIAGTNPAVDYTMGVGVAYGAKLGVPVINASGVITSVPVNAGGSGYSGGTNIVSYFGGTNINTAGAIYEGTTNFSGNGNSSGGAVSSVTVSGGGTGFNQNNPPLFFVGGTGTASTGFGTNTASYGPFTIFGEADDVIISALFVGDSFMNNELTGDPYGNNNIYERAVANRCGMQTDNVSGESSAGYDINSTKRFILYNYVKNLGLVYDKIVLALGVNDFNSNANSDVLTYVQSSITSIGNKFLAIFPNADIITTTIPPLTTTTDGGITTANQTVWATGFGGTPNYAAGGRVTDYNIAIRNGTGITIQKGFVDIAALLADPTVPSKWRVAGEFPLTSASATAFSTPETVGATPNTMIHPNRDVAIPYAVANLNLDHVLNLKTTRVIQAPKESYVATSFEQGEFLTRRLASGSAVSLTTATAANVISVVLTAGDWEVSGALAFVLTGATPTSIVGSSSRISATQGRDEATAGRLLNLITVSGTERLTLPTTPYRVAAGSTMTVYLVATATFSVGTATAYGTITAKRM